MPQKQYLHELLREEQEPFQLKSYIADRRCQLKTSVQLKKRKPIVESSVTKRTLCKHACFFSFQDSPDVRKSPLSFPSPLSASRTPMRLNVPARTAALLLEAALRIQKQQAEKKPKAQIKNVGLGLFGSILKRLKDRNRNKKREIKNTADQRNVVNEGVVVKQGEEQRNGDESVGVSVSCSCNHSRLSSAGWSESNEEKSLDLETSSSCRSEDSEEIEESVNGDFRVCENLSCSSPLSPFRFSLERCESSGRRTPDFSSPAASPNLCTRQDKEKYENEEMGNVEQEEEDEKEQCSPVSVLDPPFEDDNYGLEEDEEGHDSDLECSYAIVQRAQQQLLYKLRRFEKLAELDPIELEKIMLEDEEDYDDNAAEVDDVGCVDRESLSSRGDEDLESFASNAVIPFEIKRLVSDLISEEKAEANRELVWGRVCKRLDSWKEAKSDTIDMMVELDLRTECCEWKSFREQMEETAMEIEVVIFGSLVDEFSGELSGSLNKILT